MILNSRDCKFFRYDESGAKKLSSQTKNKLEGDYNRITFQEDTGSSVYQIDYDVLEIPEMIFCNGYQSWSESNWYLPDEKIKQLSKMTSLVWKYFHMDKYGDTPYRNKIPVNTDLYSFDYLIFKNKQTYTIIGSRSTKCIYCYDQEVNKLSVVTGNRQCSLFYKQGSLTAIFNEFSNNKTPSWFRTHTGWTSWYNYYTDITPQLLRDKVQSIADSKIPMEYFQIDDGWQEGIGDWNPNSKFEGEMESLSGRIRELGYKPGLWLAPFIVESKVKKKMPSTWIRKDNKNRPVAAGRSLYWSGKFFALEWRLEEVRNYIIESISKASNDWGFSLLKLDFLYAASLGLELHEIDHSIKEIHNIIDEARGKAKILACGAINDLQQSYAFLRVGADVSHYWEDHLLANRIKYRERVSTLASLRNTTNRSLWMQLGIGVDPDVFIIRQKKSELHPTQTNALFLLNTLLGKLCFTSDDFKDYQKEDWRLYHTQFPSVERRIIGMHIECKDVGTIAIETRQSKYLIVYNISGDSEKCTLENGIWIDQFNMYEESIMTEPMSVKILKELNENQVLYSTGHILPGEDIARAEIKESRLIVEKHLESKTHSDVLIRVPDHMDKIEYNNQTIIPFQFGNLKAVRILAEPTI